jgi:hypothetical protein
MTGNTARETRKALSRFRGTTFRTSVFRFTGHARVINKHINIAMGNASNFNQFIDTVNVGQVADKSNGIDSERTKFTHAIKYSSGGCCDCDSRAELSEKFGAGESDPDFASRASYNCAFSSEAESIVDRHTNTLLALFGLD